MRYKDFFSMPYKMLRWRLRNRHNHTMLHSNVSLELLSVGRGTYGALNILSDHELSHLTIGSYCSIGPDTLFVLNSEHRLHCLSTYPFKELELKKEEREAQSKGDIIIDDDVWIGTRAIIMSGVHVGQGAVIAAGACVTKSIPPYAVVGGVPARVIKYRFSDEIIEELLKVDYSRIDDRFVKDNIEALYSPLQRREQINSFPQKQDSKTNELFGH